MPDDRASYQPGVGVLFRGAKSIFLPGAGAVYYDELCEGSPIYTLAHGNSRVERVYVCRWEDRQNFARAMLGYPKVRDNNFNLGAAAGLPGRFFSTKFPAPNDKYVSRVIPHALTDFVDPSGGESYLYAQSISRLEGKGTRGTYDVHGVPEYHYAVVTVVYESFTFKVATDAELDKKAALKRPEKDRYITKLRKPGAEYLQLPRGIYKWFVANLANAARPMFDAAATKLLPSMELIYTWHQVPFLPQALFKNYVGCVNKDVFLDGDTSNPFIPKNEGYPPGTLLLLSAEVKPYRTAVGAFVHDITYRMKYYEPVKGRGHNYFFRYNNGLRKLYLTKLTDDGENDEAPIVPSGDRENDLGSGAPYKLNTVNFPIPASTGKSIYPYKPFIDLFTLNTTP